jgi:hypothetical protein
MKHSEYWVVGHLGLVNARKNRYSFAESLTRINFAQRLYRHLQRIGKDLRGNSSEMAFYAEVSNVKRFFWVKGLK